MKYEPGDKVRCVHTGGWNFLVVGGIYEVAETNRYNCILVKGHEPREWVGEERFEPAFPPLPDYRDLASVVKPTPFAYVTTYGNATPGPGLGYGHIWNSGYDKPPVTTPPTTTKIIHSGKTTITLFSDGSKILTRPSPDDAEKYDPFIGWCVGVVEKMYGGKEKAKKFYKQHAVVQKGKGEVETVKVEEDKKFYRNWIEGQKRAAYMQDLAEVKDVEKEQPQPTIEELTDPECYGCKHDITCKGSEEPCRTCVRNFYNHKCATGFERKVTKC